MIKGSLIPSWDIEVADLPGQTFVLGGVVDGSLLEPVALTPEELAWRLPFIKVCGEIWDADANLAFALRSANLTLWRPVETVEQADVAAGLNIPLWLFADEELAKALYRDADSVTFVTLYADGRHQMACNMVQADVYEHVYWVSDYRDRPEVIPQSGTIQLDLDGKMVEFVELDGEDEAEDWYSLNEEYFNEHGSAYWQLRGHRLGAVRKGGV